MRPLVAYADVVETDPTPGIELLRAAGFDVVVVGSADPAELAARAAGAAALLIGYGTVDDALLDALPALRLVATQSVGCDMVDLDACARRGVWVSNVPAAATEEVASHALAMTLAVLRGLPFLDRDVRAGHWDGTRHVLRRLSEVTVGVVGLGRIGRRYAEQVAPLAGRVVGHDPALAAATGGEPELLELDALLAVSDVVSLHLPLTPDTHHLLDDRRLGLLPRDAVVVNVSRGALVDPVALLAHLDSGHLAAAALDVLTEEPPGLDEPLVRHPRTLVTPHAAYLSPASARDYVLQQAENAIAFLRDGRPVTPVTGPAPALTTGARPDDAPLNDPHQPHLNQDQENPC